MTERSIASIPAISRERVIELVEQIQPLVERDGELWRIAPCDPWKVAFSWSPSLRSRATGLEAVRTIRTLHTFGAPVFFKPTVAEVLAQLPDDLEGVVAFSTEGPDDADDLNREIEALNAGFHVATTTLYRREVPQT